MDKILFIVPPHITFDQFTNPSYNERITHKKHGNFGNVLTDMPLGVMSLSSYVKKHVKTIKTKLIDFNIVLNKMDNFKYKSFKDFFREVILDEAKYKPTIICISSLFNPSYQNMLDIGEICREIFPKAYIFAGGALPTNMYRDIFNKTDAFDALCYGEGELPLLGFVLSKDKKKYLSNNPTWITKNKVNKGKEFSWSFIEDLDEIPFYDYDICETDNYGLNPAITAYKAGANDKKQNFHVMTSRGCPNRCCFCASHTVHGRKIRYYSINRVREDFIRLRDQYGARTIVFQDDHLMGNKQRALEIINLVKELQLTVIFQNGLALYALDRKVLETLKSAGVDQLLLSVESGSERVLKEIMHKPLNLSIVKHVVDDCRELGIYTNVNILIGLPGETKLDIEDARSFLKTINANWFLIFCANPLVGSEMFDICLKKNYLKGDYVGSDFKKAVVETKDFTAEYIREMAYFLNLELNFVENSDFRLGDYGMALKGFENAIGAKNNHAIAYYYASLCCGKLGDSKKAQQYMDNAKINAKKSFWRKYVGMLNIPI